MNTESEKIRKETKMYYNIQSRNKKSLSNALLMFCILKENGSISFVRTKDSKFALKVLSGNRIVLNNVEYTMDTFNKYSFVICEQFKEIVFDSEKRKLAEFFVNKSNFSTLDPCNFEDKIPTERLNKIAECRAREARFSNTMAWLLLDMGYTLKFNNKHMKICNSANHFYIFDEVIDPNGDVFSIQSCAQQLTDMIELILAKLMKTNFVTISKENIMNCSISKMIKIFNNTSPSVYDVSFLNRKHNPF